MADEEEVRWLRAAANELNNLLQLIGESQAWLKAVIPPDVEAQKFFHILNTGTARAREVAATLEARAGGNTKAIITVPPGTKPATPEPSAAVQAVISRQVEVMKTAGPNELILIVDDEEFILLLAQEVLTEAGYRVITAKDGLQALAIYRQLRDQISLVVLDFMMPVMDGEEVFEEMQLVNPKVPVVLSSGFAEQDRLRNMLSRGLRGFIPKPYTQDKLLNQIRQTLDALKQK